MSHLLVVAVALALSATGTPLVRALAHRSGWLDVPAARKVKTRAVPRLGGVAIAIAFFGALTAAGLTGAGAPADLLSQPASRALLVGAAAMAIMGLLDDLLELRARTKFVGQLLIAILVVVMGLSIREVAMPWGEVELGPFAGSALTVLWLVGVVNALNLVDGLDGLASGVALAAAGALYVIGAVDGQSLTPLLMAALGGAVLGFLAYNLHPASIIMGDSGSMFLGFALAAAAVTLSDGRSEALPAAVPLLALGLPLLDTAIAIVRRVRLRVPLFRADREHIHHKLLAAGLSPRGAMLTLHAGALVLAALAVAGTWLGALTATLILVVAATIGVLLALRLESAARASA